MDNLVKNELYVINEYGIEHQKPNPKISEKLIKKYKAKINLNVHKTCVACQIRQIDKYGEDFKIKCTYIPKSLPINAKSQIDKIVK